MMTTRRAFIHTIGGLAAASIFPTARGVMKQPQLRFATKRLRNDMVVFGDLSTGGNVLAVPTEGGPILIDVKHAHLGPDVFSDTFAVYRAKPSLIINTHHHADHTGGNWVFSTIANIVAHKNLNPRIAGNLARYAQGAANRVNELKQAAAPEGEIKAAQSVADQIKTLTADVFKARQDLTDGVNMLNIGGVTVQCYHYGNGHTDNDLVIFFPTLNILHMGDLLFHNLHPFIDRSAKATTVGWQNSVREAMKLGDADTIVVPGHGEVTDKTALPKQIEYFDQLREIVSKAIADGKTRDEVVAMKPEVFKNVGFDQIRPVTFGGMYDELKEAEAAKN